MSMKYTILLDEIRRSRQYAHYLMRSAKRSPYPPEWGIEEHPNMREAKIILGRAIRTCWEARDEREKNSYADDMRKLRLRASRHEKDAPGKVAVLTSEANTGRIVHSA